MSGRRSGWGRSTRPLVAIVVLVAALGWAQRDLWPADLRSEVPASGVMPYAPELAKLSGFDRLSTFDQRFVVWLIARNARTWIEDPSSMFDAEICHPAPQSLALGEPALTLGLLGALPWALSGDPILTYNVVVLMLPLVSAVAMLVFVYGWTRRLDAALVAAIVYAFHTAKLADVVHPYTSDTAWTLFAFHFFARWLERGRWLDGLGFSASCALQIGGSLYPLLGAAAVGIPYAIWCVRRLGWRNPGKAQWGMVAGLIALALHAAFAPFLAKSGGVLELRTSKMFLEWSALLPGSPGSPGIFAAALVVFAVLPSAWTKCAEEKGWPTPRFALLIGAGLALLLASEPSLYSLLALVLPGLDFVRAPMWIATSAHMALAALTGFGVARLSLLLPKRHVGFVGALLVTGALVATLQIGSASGTRYRLEELRPSQQALDLFHDLAAAGNDGPILELPVDRVVRRAGGFEFAGPHVSHANSMDQRSMSVLVAAYHQRPTSRCYNSFVPQEVLRAWWTTRGLPGGGAVAAIAAQGFTTLILHHPPDAGAMRKLRDRINRKIRRGRSSLVPLHGSREVSVYRLPDAAPKEQRASVDSRGGP